MWRPAPFLTLDDAELRAVGFSRQKARYVRLLATAVEEGSFSFETVAGLEDDAAAEMLLGLTGIGPWTAANYLLFADQRADVWPRGDRALVVSLGRAIGSAEPPAYDDADVMADRWRPWRAVAARPLVARLPRWAGVRPGRVLVMTVPHRFSRASGRLVR